MMFFVTAGLTFFISLSPSWLLRFLFLLQKRGKGPEKTLPNWCLLTSGTLGWWGSRYSGKFQVLGKSSSVRSSFPGLHELVGVTPNNWVRHGKLTEEMRQPLDLAAGWPGALLSVPSPGHPHPLPWLTHLHPKCHLQNVLEHRSWGFTHVVGAATGCFAPLCPKSPNHHLKFHGPLLSRALSLQTACSGEQIKV